MGEAVSATDEIETTAKLQSKRAIESRFIKGKHDAIVCELLPAPCVYRSPLSPEPELVFVFDLWRASAERERPTSTLSLMRPFASRRM